jgi:hypothetical protein
MHRQRTAVYEKPLTSLFHGKGPTIKLKKRGGTGAGLYPEQFNTE